MHNEPLARLVKKTVGTASRLFKKDGAIYVPIWIAFKPDGQCFIVKDAPVPLLRALFELEDVVRYVVATEAWMVDACLEPDKPLPPPGTARSHPDRVECIYVSAEDAHEGCLVAMREIIRSGGPAKLGPLTMGKPRVRSGSAFDLLPRKGAVQVTRGNLGTEAAVNAAMNEAKTERPAAGPLRRKGRTKP